MRLNLPQALWRDPRFLPLLKELERAFQQFESRIDKLPFDRQGRVAKTLDMNNNRLANVASPASGADAVPLRSLRQIVEDIEDERADEETAEIDRYQSGARSGNRTTRLLRRVEEFVDEGLAAAVPSGAPPNIVATTGAVGTTSDPPVFALSDHTHGATIPTSAPPAIADTGAVGTTTSPLIFALSNHTHQTDCVITQGQLVGHDGTSKTAIPAPTTTGHVLTADLTLGVRMKWEAPSGGGGGGGGLTHPQVMARGVFSGPF